MQDFKSNKEFYDFILAVSDKLRYFGLSDAADLLYNANSFVSTSSSEWFGEIGLAVQTIRNNYEVNYECEMDLFEIMNSVKKVWPEIDNK